MSAIFGILHTQGAMLERESLEAMRKSLIHRGPDGSGIFLQGSVGLGHLLQHVTPESIYEQSPCRSGNLVISAQARLDEREVLLNKLQVPPALHLSMSDPELIGLAYQRWGERCVEHLLGDYAFALWDEVAQKLFCAKDPLGIKPFFYAHQQAYFVFATELQAVVATGLFPTQIDHGHVRDYVIDLYDRPESCSWTNVKILRGGHTLVLEAGKLRIQRYWKPEPREQIWYKDPRDYGHHLRSLLEQAIADRLRTPFPVGLMLSGGLDSSSIACIAAAQLRKRGLPLYTASSVLSADWPHPDEDERVYIQSVLDKEPNIEASFVYSQGQSFLSGLNQKFDQHHALPDMWHYIDTELCARLQAQQVRRELSGYMGDMTVSLFGIYPLAHLLRKGLFRRFCTMLQQRRALKKSSDYALLKSELLLPLLPFSLLKAWHRFKRRPYPWDLEALPFAFEPSEKKALYARLEAYHQSMGFFGPRNWYDSIWHEADEFAAAELDCNAAHAGIENTFPLFDKRILDFLLQLPIEAFFERGMSRGLIRMATKDCLPPIVNQRQNKGDYSPGYHHIVKKDIAKVRALLDVINKSKGYINSLDIYKTKNALVSLEKSLNSSSFGPHYWSILKICMWIAFSHWEVSKGKL